MGMKFQNNSLIWLVLALAGIAAEVLLIVPLVRLVGDIYQHIYQYQSDVSYQPGVLGPPAPGPGGDRRINAGNANVESILERSRPQGAAVPLGVRPVYSCSCEPEETISPWPEDAGGEAGEAELRPDGKGLRYPYYRNGDIKVIQSLLKRAGYDPGKIDGIYGPMTAIAVARFQAANGLMPDAIIGPRTWVKLGELALSLDPVKPVAARPSAPPKGKVAIVIDTERRTLTILSDKEPYAEFPVAVGKPSTPSPPGEWKVVKKGAWSGGFGTRWMGLNVPWGIYGIHGTNKPWSIGTAASGGCIRMFNHDVELIFDWIKIGTPVKIIGNPFDPLRVPRRLLGPGERGADVLEVQKRLKRLGFFKGKPDGFYSESTVEAVKAFQKSRNLKVTGEVVDDTYDALGLILFE
ncbi:MAG TPA: L,D-transpeptidase family protein [Firmicutes bacterium]|nr:L,D-transpeptidase family protein [Bacillota bacterium]